MRILVSGAPVMWRLKCILLVMITLWASGDLLAKAPGSLHELGSTWKDQNGLAFAWKDMEGQVVLLSMVYTSCEQTCPLIITELSALQKALPSHLQDRVQVLIFTFDPDRDTQGRLAAYAKARHLNPKWRFLRSSPDDVQELAAVLNFRYKKMESEDYAHSNIFTVLDQKGHMRHQQLELFRGRGQTVEMIQSILESAGR
ncbi:MAG TPA: SCO family protein [Oligoflexus sp.]|uniref:SCO family protein n=1 Tax=Oligoflexus sp. TaxID=1971216 RepID=UPI002D583DCD|nr:SCO family protein [Oligoflexus sp.]HYX36712.1 SCO family protein [Oligoflexus sp.]